MPHPLSHPYFSFTTPLPSIYHLLTCDTIIAPLPIFLSHPYHHPFTILLQHLYPTFTFTLFHYQYFVNIIGYKNHMSYTHNGVKVHPEDGTVHHCHECTQTFRTFAALATHTRITHGMENGYACQICAEKGNEINFKVSLN